LFLFRSDPHHGHEAAGEGSLSAVAEKEIGAAGGAEFAPKDVLRAEACGKELRAVGSAEVEVDSFRGGLVARGHHVEPLEGVWFFAGAGLVEMVGGIGKLRGEFGDEVGGNFVAARADGRADGGEKIGRLAAVFVVHAADGFFDDAGKSSLPAGVNGGDGAFFGIDKENRDAIGGLDGKKQAGSFCGGGVTFAGLWRGGGEWPEQRGMDLLQGRQGEVVGTEGGLESLAIGGDVFGRVPFHEAKIEQFFAV